MDKELFDFRYELLKAGFQYDVSDSKYLLETAKACAKTYGVAAGGGVALATATAGAVAVPGVGEVPGYVIGFLAGMVGGTLMLSLIHI